MKDCVLITDVINARVLRDLHTELERSSRYEIILYLLICFSLVWASEMQLAKFKDVTLLQHSAAAAIGASCTPACGSHPERVVLLGQVGQDVGVEQNSLKEVAPQCCQLGAELAHVPADLLRHLLMVFLQLMKGERKDGGVKQSGNTSTLTICTVLFQDVHHQHKVYNGPELLLLKELQKKKQQRFIHQSINPHCSVEENAGRRVPTESIQTCCLPLELEENISGLKCCWITCGS